MRTIHIVQLYPKEMNIYGDMGNLLILRKRSEWRELPVRVSIVGIGDKLPNDTSLLIGGGGQDAGQLAIEEDLQGKATTIRHMASDGVSMLMICGLYQMFGHRFVTHEGAGIKGIGVFDMETRASQDRLIGNTIITSPWGELIGYENHSGKTYLAKGAEALGTVKRGAGNNNEDGQEGCRIHNAFGSYLHGPVLSKNPAFADALLGFALEHAGLSSELLTPLDDSIELRAAKVAATRPR